MKRIVAFTTIAVLLTAVETLPVRGQGNHAAAGVAATPAAETSPRASTALPGAPAPPQPAAGVTVSTASEGPRSAGMSTNKRRTVMTDSAPPLVLQFDSAGEKTLAAMDEDLAVMTRLLEKAVERGLDEDVPPDKMGIRMWATYGGRSVRALYLEGFGALFTVKVNVPLLGSAPAEKKEPEKRESEWEDTRRELRGLPAAGAAETRGTPPVEYDAAQVEALKKELLRTLKNASNIRNLKPNDFVAVTVFGPLAGEAARVGLSELSRSSVAVGYGGYGGSGYGDVRRHLLVDHGGTQPGTVLTLRVRKSDVDDFANGKLDFDAFQKKATSTTYVGNGYGLASLNPWSQSGVTIQTR